MGWGALSMWMTGFTGLAGSEHRVTCPHRIVGERSQTHRRNAALVRCTPLTRDGVWLRPKLRPGGQQQQLEATSRIASVRRDEGTVEHK
eukprot:scaffold600_cov279-Pinguiococcus_pyrenoidosus.AAC.4